jgi:hypothetical protein
MTRERLPESPLLPRLPCTQNVTDCPGFGSEYHAAHVVSAYSGIPIEELLTDRERRVALRKSWVFSDDAPDWSEAEKREAWGR